MPSSAPFHLSCARLTQASVARALALSLQLQKVSPDAQGGYRLSRLALGDLCETLLYRAAADLEQAQPGCKQEPEALRCFILAHLQAALLHWLADANCSPEEHRAVAQCLSGQVPVVAT